MEKKKYPLTKGEKNSLEWDIEDGCATLWVRENCILNGKKKSIRHWVLSQPPIDMEGDDEEGIGVFLCFGNNTSWHINAEYDPHRRRVEIYRKSKGRMVVL